MCTRRTLYTIMGRMVTIAYHSSATTPLGLVYSRLATLRQVLFNILASSLMSLDNKKNPFYQ